MANPKSERDILDVWPEGDELDDLRIQDTSDESAISTTLRLKPLKVVKPGDQAKAPKPQARFMSAEEWLHHSFHTAETDIVIGSREQAIIRPMTKNLIEAPEKAFKTTFMLRVILGLSQGVTVFPEFPVTRPSKVLYVHGELSPPEIQERTRAAAQGLPGPLNNFFQGRDLNIHLVAKSGQEALENIVREIRPDQLVLDPWQSFIIGNDENEFRDVSKALHFLDHLIEKYVLTIYLPTHMGKDHSRGTRGHSSIAGWRDTLIRLERKKSLLTVSVDPRWAAPLKPFNLEFHDGTLWSTEKNTFSGQTAKIRAYVEQRDGVATKEEVGSHLGLAGDALRKALKRAEQNGAIAVQGDMVRLAVILEPDPLDVTPEE